MATGIKVLRICSWILLALAGYIYGDIAVQAMRYSSVQVMIGTDGIHMSDISLHQWLKSAYLLLPSVLLVAALVLLFIRRRTLQLTALGVVIAAGVCYCVIPPQSLMISIYTQYRFFPNFFPFNYLPSEFKVNLIPFVSSVLHLLLHQFLYLAALVLLVITMVMSMVQKKRETAAVNHIA